MDYKLAKRLKDAGFPFAHNNCHPVTCRHLGIVYCEECGEYLSSGDNTAPIGHKHCDKYNVGFLVSPTLSELIKACGDAFSSLDLIAFHKDKDKANEEWVNLWRCIYWNKKEDPYKTIPYIIDNNNKGYESPEEAVANLWLELHKK